MPLRLPRQGFSLSGVALAAVMLTLTLGVSGAQAAAGRTDWWEWGPPKGYANALAIQTNGKIVAAGASTKFGDANGFMLARYTTRGAIDTSFGTDGTVLTPFGSSSATAVAIQPDGEIVVAGYSDASGSDDFALARYTTSGTLDSSFGTGGEVLTDFGSASKDQGASLAIQPNGKIVVAGSANGPKLHKFALARYTTRGTLDKRFGRGGKVLTGFRRSNHSSAYGVAIQKNGKIVAAGSTQHAKGTYFAVARYSRRGQLDGRFGSRGRVRTGVGSSTRSEGEALAVAIQPGGKIPPSPEVTIVSPGLTLASPGR